LSNAPGAKDGFRLTLGLSVCTGLLTISLGDVPPDVDVAGEFEEMADGESSWSKLGNSDGVGMVKRRLLGLLIVESSCDVEIDIDARLWPTFC